MQRTLAVWSPVVCAVLLLGLIVGSWSQPACYPWRDAANNEPVHCYDESNNDNPGWKLQTISEMTARSGTTAELLSGLAALCLICIYHVLWYVEPAYTTWWHVVKISYAVGALGFVGLTVWNLRVQSTVHTCFTSQTILAVFVQTSALTFAQKKRYNILTALWAVLFLSMIAYVVLFSSHGAPHPGKKYFELKYYTHAIAQIIFFEVYLIFLSQVARVTPLSPKAQRANTQHDLQSNFQLLEHNISF